MSTLELTVEGMHCGGCSGRLKRALESTEGVVHADVVLETKRVTVEFDQARIQADALRERVRASGFSVAAA